MRLTSPPPDRPRGFGLEIYQWRPSSSLRHVPQRPQLLLLLRGELGLLAGGAAGGYLGAVGGEPGVLELAGHAVGLARIVHRLHAPRGVQRQRVSCGGWPRRPVRGRTPANAFSSRPKIGLGGLGERRLGLAADPSIAGPVVVGLGGSETALPEELEVAVHQGEAVDAIAQVELGKRPLLVRLGTGWAPRRAPACRRRPRSGSPPPAGWRRGGQRASASLRWKPAGSLTTSGTSTSTWPRLPPWAIWPFSPNSSPWSEVTTRSVLSHWPLRFSASSMRAEHLVGVGGVQLVHGPEDPLLSRAAGSTAGS